MVDWEALLFAVAGGVFMGTYPVPIKCQRVLAADVHPVVFQLYKSTWVCLTGFFFLIPRVFEKSAGNSSSQLVEAPLYVFSWWATVSAAGWVPSGLTTIFSVPLIGVGLAVGEAVGAVVGVSVVVVIGSVVELKVELEVEPVPQRHGAHQAAVSMKRFVGRV